MAYEMIMTDHHEGACLLIEGKVLGTVVPMGERGVVHPFHKENLIRTTPLGDIVRISGTIFGHAVPGGMDFYILE